MAPARKKQKLSNSSAEIARTSGDAADRNGGAEQQRRSLFIRSLPANTTTKSLTDLFSESYPVKHATAVIDPTTKQCRGYGFVTFADAEDAEGAKTEFNGHILEGRKLRIEVAEPRQRQDEAGEVRETANRKRAPKVQDVPQPSRLIVRNLPWTIKTPEQLSKLFMSYGKIKQAYIPKKGAGLMAGFGFVVLRGRKNAENALLGINGKEVDGRTLAVDWAVSKEVYEDVLKKGPEAMEEDGNGEEAGEFDSHQDAADRESDEEDVGLGSLEDSHGSDGETDDEDPDLDDEVGDESDGEVDKSEDRSTTLFVRNLPFTCTDEDLEDQFIKFGKVRYARVVMDPGTGRSKGTGFVCFFNKTDADACFHGAPRQTVSASKDSQDAKARPHPNSILQNESSDPSGDYTIDGRVLQVSRAVDKSEATRLTEEGVAHRHKRNDDKRRLYLLSEGTISSKSKLWEKLSLSERNMRGSSAKQRKVLIESNPSLHLSLTRLSIRNIPRSITSKDLKSLAREAVVGFATDVKAGSREKLSKEELARGGEEMDAVEKARKKAGKGVVKQAKVVFEGASGSKVDERSGAGKSRGYGFIEYYTHRSALMGLRWLNGHAVGYQVKEQQHGKASKEALEDRKKRLIVEFAIENAQVVMRRNGREQKLRDRNAAAKEGATAEPDATQEPSQDAPNGTRESLKRKRGPGKVSQSTSQKPKLAKSRKMNDEKLEAPRKKPVDEKIARRNQIIGRKRAMRKNRKG